MSEPDHFEGLKPLNHVVQKKVAGKLDTAEIHGVELPGHLSAATDAMRETALVALVLWTLLYRLGAPDWTIFKVLISFTVCYLVFRTGRSALLGWQHLERLHRVMEEERWEINHQRKQERQELLELYAAKGFEGKLLDDVVDVLMADNDRLLKVMLLEELGLSLEKVEHPLWQGVGAAVGSALAAFFIMIGFFLPYPFGPVGASLFTIAFSTGIAASRQKNEVIPATLWSLGIGALSFGVAYFLVDFILPKG